MKQFPVHQAARLVSTGSKCANAANTSLRLHKASDFISNNYLYRFNLQKFCTYRTYRDCYSCPLLLCIRSIHNQSSSSSPSSSAMTSYISTAELKGSDGSKHDIVVVDDDKHELPQEWTQIRQSSAQTMMFDKKRELPIVQSKYEQEIAKWCKHAENVLQKEELDFDGYVTITIKKCKDVILTESSTQSEIANALALLDAESTEVERLVGHRVQRPVTERTLLRQQLEREQAKLTEARNPFKRAVPKKPDYTVNINAEGMEELKVFRTKPNLCEDNKVDSTHNSFLSREEHNNDTESEERKGVHVSTKECETIHENVDTQATSTLQNETNSDNTGKRENLTSEVNHENDVKCTESSCKESENETIEVTVADLNHVRFLRSIALRRLAQFDLAEKLSFDILRSDCYHVDAIKSLLEMYLGFETYNRVNFLLLFLQHEFEKEQAMKIEKSTSSFAGEITSAQSDSSDNEKDEKVTLDANINSKAANMEESCVALTDKEKNENCTKNARDENTESTVGKDDATEHVEVEIVENVFRPIDIALQLLAAQIVNAISRQVCIHGEGRAIRSIAHILTQLAQNMNRSMMSCLIEAIFRTNEEHQFRLKYEEVEIPAGVRMTAEDYYKKSKQILQTTIISILKGLLLPQMLHFINEPICFRCMLLSNLYSALREADRTQESFRVAEEYISYYKKQKSLFLSSLPSAISRESEMLIVKESGKSRQITEVNEESCKEKCVKCQEENEGTQEKSQVNCGATSSIKVTQEEKEKSEHSLTSANDVCMSKVSCNQHYDIISDQEEVYKQTVFAYLHDYILAQPAHGRNKCLAAIDEFPNAAEPWILLSLVLHKEDARANLDDAIVAVRHAMNLEPTNLRAIMVLANYYKAGKRYALYRELMKRYATLENLLMRGSSPRELMDTIAELQALPEVITPAHEAAEVKEVESALNENYAQMERAMAYSVDIDKEKRTFRQVQLASPMMQQEINIDRASYMNEPLPTE